MEGSGTVKEVFFQVGDEGSLRKQTEGKSNISRRPAKSSGFVMVVSQEGNPKCGFSRMLLCLRCLLCCVALPRPSLAMLPLLTHKSTLNKNATLKKRLTHHRLLHPPV